MNTKVISGLFTTIILLSLVNMAFPTRAQAPEELQYDDGTPNGSVRWGTVAYDNMFAVRFTAPYAAQITTLRFYLLGGPFEDLTIHVLDTIQGKLTLTSHILQVHRCLVLSGQVALHQLESCL